MSLHLGMCLRAVSSTEEEVREAEEQEVVRTTQGKKACRVEGRRGRRWREVNMEDSLPMGNSERKERSEG
eukprot:766427-Hanusia_phi.AAC.1